MEIFAISGLINGIIASAFGILVFVKNWREKNNQIFFLMTAALALWSFSYWRWLLADTYDASFFWVRLLSIGSLFIPVLFFHWVISLLNTKAVNKYVLYISYLFIALSFFFIESPLFIDDLSERAIFTFWPNSGLLYNIYFSFLYIGLISYTIYLLIRSYFLERNLNNRGQILYILLGAIFGFGGGLTNFPLWFGISLLPYGNFLVGAFPFFLGYSILKHRLFNAKTIATEILVFFISIILLVQAIISESTLELILRSGLFVIIAVFGYLLIKSVYREVSQREKIEKLAADLQKANDRLKELDKQKSEFVAFATHQLRAPLTAMKGYSSLILEGDMGQTSKEVREAVLRIFESSNTLATMVDDYLNITRIELGTMRYSFETIDLKTLVETVIAEVKPNIERAKSVKFTFEADPGSDYHTNADRDKLKQVIGNLIDNSLKYTPKGYVQAILSVDKDANKLVFKVKDNGIGIAPEVLPKLFQKFSRADNANQTNIKGTGLGLFVAKDIIQAHHGTIRAESAGEGKGSTFTVDLPAAKSGN